MQAASISTLYLSLLSNVMTSGGDSTHLPEGKPEGELSDQLMEAAHHTTGLMGVALGVHVGLFDVMAGMGQSATSQEIAEIGGYKERYVREWLAKMVSYGIVSLDEDRERYSLPTNHRKVLTGKDVTLPIYLSCIAGNAQSYHKVAACFRQDGPLGIEADTEGVNDGLDVITRRTYNWDFVHGRMLSQVPGLLQQLESGIEVLEIGSHECGVLLMLAEHFPKSRFLATDIDADAILVGERRAREKNITNIDCKPHDIYKMPDDLTGRFDYLLMIDVLHDLPHIDSALGTMVELVKPGAHLSIVELDGSSVVRENANNAMATQLYFFSLFRCLPLTLNIPGSDGAGAAWGCQNARQAIKNAGLNIILEDPEPEMSRHYICRRN